MYSDVIGLMCKVIVCLWTVETKIKLNVLLKSLLDNGIRPFCGVFSVVWSFSVLLMCVKAVKS